MSLFIDIILDVIFELYDDVLTVLFPNKAFSKKVRVTLKVICFIISLINFLFIVAGVWFICYNKLFLGVLLTTIGTILILTHVFMAIFLKIKSSRQ